MKQPAKAILIDDEPAARRILLSMLLEYADDVTIIAEASTGTEAVAMINELKPDLIFLDIQMPDLSGFEVLEKIYHQPNIIFTTAYDQFAIKAFQAFSVDYLLKPIREERLAQSIGKLKQFGKLTVLPDAEKFRSILNEISAIKKPAAFAIKQGDKIILIRFEMISYFEAADKYVAVFTVDGKKYLSDQTLTALAQKLPSQFIRVQKSYIINKERIREIHKHFNGRFVLTLDDKAQTRITTGLTFYESIKEELGL